MPDQPSGDNKKKNFTIRDVPLSDHAAFDRMSKRLRMPRETFGRALVHRAIWNAPWLFERDLREALGPEEPGDDEPLQEEEPG